MGETRRGKKKAEQAAKLWEPRRREIERMYFAEKLSMQKIATHYGVSLAGLRFAMQRLGIPSRGHGRAGQENGRYVDGKQARGYRKVIAKDICRACGTIKDLGIHHKNDDHYDNRPENLEVLCNSCHMSETKQRWWDAKRNGKPLPKSNGPVGWVRSS